MFAAGHFSNSSSAPLPVPPPTDKSIYVYENTKASPPLFGATSGYKTSLSGTNGFPLSTKSNGMGSGLANPTTSPKPLMTMDRTVEEKSRDKKEPRVDDKESKVNAYKRLNLKCRIH